MEIASARALIPLLQAGYLSVGVSVDITHSAPTPVGALFTAQAMCKGKEGKLFFFGVMARDAAVKLREQFTRGLSFIGRG